MVDNIAKTAIPNITALRRDLQYEDPHLSRCSAFYDDMRVFRKNFVSSKGMRGTELYDWRSLACQLALSEMTDAYLEKNGPLFWPDDPSASNYNKYQYTKHGQ